LYRDEVKPFRSMGGGSAGRRWLRRTSWRMRVSTTAHRAIGTLLTLQKNVEKGCFSVQQQMLKIL